MCIRDRPWDLDRLYGGVHVLPPYQKASGSDWYKGTANAIYQNIAFIAVSYTHLDVYKRQLVALAGCSWFVCIYTRDDDYAVLYILLNLCQTADIVTD